MNASQLSTSLVVVDYLFSLVDQLGKVKDMVNKPGGATKEDIASLMTFHDSERVRVQAIVDSMPDVPASATGKALLDSPT